ncbi:MAG: type I phosphomannose isomerase catalytic subunit, partial [Pseudomonadota bacterium]
MAAALPDVLPLKPYLREMVWGGRRLAELYGKPLPPGRPIGESFEVSALPERDSTVASGPLEGRALGCLVAEYGEALVGRTTVERYGPDFPLLIKLIDAAQDLSVQVHPDDAYVRARKLGSFGKMEAWYVVHSDGGRVALGLKDGVDRAELAQAIRAGAVEGVVQFHAVAPGDVVSLPPGTVHALCRGVMVYEVQQSSDLTFRLYDYGRL